MLKNILIRKAIARHFNESNINMSAASSVAIFPKIGIAYNRIKKNANTATMLILKELEDGFVFDKKNAKETTIHFSNISFSKISCISKCSYFVIIRNPYERLLSAFLDKFRQIKYKTRFGDFDLNPNGFNEFVNWLEREGMNANNHWGTQKSRLIIPLEKYNKVIRFENLQEELNAYLLSLSLPINPKLLQMVHPSDHTKPTNASAQLKKFYTPSLCDRVYYLFEEDFKILGYPRELISSAEISDFTKN